MKRTNAVIVALIAVAVVIGIFIVKNREQPTGNATRKTIAIANLQKHPILDAVEKGVLDQLSRDGYTEGAGTRYILRNAGGDMQRVAAVADELAAQNPDVIVAISTPVAQAIVKKFKGKIVFGALTDPISAGILNSVDGSSTNISGTTDAIPYEEQLKLIRRVSPAAKRLGLLFNPGEAPSQYAVRKIKEMAPKLDFELIEGPVNSTIEMHPVASGLVGRVDALLISTDNTVAAGIAGAVKVGIEKRIPVYACDSGSVEKGAIAAVSPGYYDIGLDTGRLVTRILRGESNLAVMQPKSGQIYLNKKAAELMNVAVPPEVVRQAVKTFEEIQ